MAGFESSPVVSVIERIPRKSEYLIRFSDGSEIRVLKEDLGRFDLGEGACIDQATIEEICFAYARGKARQAALRLLRIRPRTEQELRRRFRTQETPGDVTDRVITDLKTEGLVNDRLFTRLWIEEKVAKGTHGRRLIGEELKARGIAPGLVKEELGRLYSNPRELEVARQLALRRLAKGRPVRRSGAGPGRGDAPGARQSIYNYLLRRGFGSDVAADAARYAMDAQDAEHAQTGEDEA